MTFNSRVKSELCRAETARDCCARAELYGSLLLGQQFDLDGIRIYTKHPAFAERLSRLVKAVLGVSVEPHGDFHITDPEIVSGLYRLYGYDGAGIALHLNNAVLENECCPASFWRGAFLAGGSVTDPSKGYHLEIVTPRLPLTRELKALMLECGIEPKQTVRAGSQLLYLKASEGIEDFLTLIGAPISAMALMEMKIEKDLRNRVNRAVNCETGNVSKTVEAYARQRVAIERLMSSPQWDTLQEPLKRIAAERLANPEESLTELSERLGMGRSALNHRLRKLEQLSGRLAQ